MTHLSKQNASKTFSPVVINRDGSLNIHRPREKGKFFFDLYHYFFSISWPKFFAYLILFFFATNVIFACLYFAAGPNALDGIHTDDDFLRLLDCFFFSVQSLSSPYTPAGIWPNLLVTLQMYAGMLVLVIVTGLLFLRFARPSARVIFSDKAIISKFNGKPCFLFRVANERLNQVVEARMTLTFTRMETSLEGETSRRFYNMTLERDYTPIFALSWTIRHYIDENSPLYGMTPQKMQDEQVVIFASFQGIDETLSQTITTKSVYRWDEVAYDKRFKDILIWKDNKMHIDLKGIHAMEEVKC